MNLKSVLGSLGAIGGIILAAFLVIQLQCGRIDKLSQKNQELERQRSADSLYVEALKGIIMGIGDINPCRNLSLSWYHIRSLRHMWGRKGLIRIQPASIPFIASRLRPIITAGIEINAPESSREATASSLTRRPNGEPGPIIGSFMGPAQAIQIRYFCFPLATGPLKRPRRAFLGAWNGLFRLEAISP